MKNLEFLKILKEISRLFKFLLKFYLILGGNLDKTLEH